MSVVYQSSRHAFLYTGSTLKIPYYALHHQLKCAYQLKQGGTQFRTYRGQASV